MARESLLGQPGGAPESTSARVSGEASGGEAQEHHPDGSWRADALGKSRHARLSDHVREPLERHDPEAARRICAEVTRNALGDFAPAMMLVAKGERLRCQVVATWLTTLFDFARQTGVEGERLAALNRLEFGLEQSLDGEPIGQPVFVCMAIEERRRPFDRDALDALMAAARRRAVRPRLETAEEVDAESRELAGAISTTISGRESGRDQVEQWAALLRLRGVLDLGEGMRRDRAALPRRTLPSRDDLRRVTDRASLDGAVRAELARIRPALEAAVPGREVPDELRAAARYLRLAGLSLLEGVERRGWQVVSDPPGIGLGRRLALLARSRLGGR